jgi:2-phosphosulfolactate phosphatase
MPSIELCLTPDLYAHRSTLGTHHSAIVVDILRASSTLTAMAVHYPKPVAITQDMDTLRQLKREGYKIVSERDGLQSDFADYGNSPLNFMDDRLGKNTRFAFSSTNGTRTLLAVKEAKHVILGSFLNMEKVARTAAERAEDTVIVCSGWKGRFSLEDTVFAGALSEILSTKYHFHIATDAAAAALTIWQVAKENVLAYIACSEHYQRLSSFGFQESADFCFRQNIFDQVAVFKDGSVVQYAG